MTNDKQSPPRVEAVYLGPCQIGSTTKPRKGSLFCTPEQLAKAENERELSRLASAFSEHRGLSVGVVYSGTGEVDESGKLVKLQAKGLAWGRRLESPLLNVFEIEQRAQNQVDKQAAIKRRIKGNPRLMSEVEGLADLLRRATLTERWATQAAIMELISEAAIRRGRKLDR